MRQRATPAKYFSQRNLLIIASSMQETLTLEHDGATSETAIRLKPQYGHNGFAGVEHVIAAMPCTSCLVIRPYRYGKSAA
jgi:hypothetical protein